MTDTKTLEQQILESLEAQGIAIPSDMTVEQFLRGFWASLPTDQKELAEFKRRAQNARENFTVDGFRDYFYCIWRMEMAPYARRWAKKFMSGKWTILECFRGSTKSTTLTITFASFVLGHFPETSLLIVQANDTAANKSTSSIKMIIEQFSGWKETFPHVVPDKGRGWGAEGYFIKDTNIEQEKGYGAWVEKTMQDHVKDPSFVGFGILSGNIVGMHPRWLFLDDVHDRQNSVYPKDRENVVQTVRENLLPVLTKPGENKPFVGIACTFWDENDAYHILLETGLFEHIKTPIFEYVEEGGDAEWQGKSIKLAWPEGFPVEMVKLYYDSNDLKTFKREYLCDESSTIDSAYRYQSYPETEIDLRWVAVVGADPVSVLNQGEGISHFAALDGLLSPFNQVVVTDGILEKCGALAGEEYIVNAQSTYPNFMKAVIEGNGSGAIFGSTVSRHPGMVVQTVKVQDIGKGSKFDRQYKFLEPLVRSGAVRVSTADKPILRAVRKYFDTFPNFTKEDPLADLGDALVLLVYGFPSVWISTVTSIPVPTPAQRAPRRRFVDVGRYHYFGGSR